jgi:hypothetical protein
MVNAHAVMVLDLKSKYALKKKGGGRENGSICKRTNQS